RNDYRFRVNDLFIGEEGVGQVSGRLAMRGTELSGEVDAASPRLAMTGTGRIALTSQYDSDLTFRFHDTSLDPYVRLFVPRLSPFTTAVVGGALRLVGEDTRLRVSGTVGLGDQRIALRAAGDANLGILQGFFRDVRGSGRA